MERATYRTIIDSEADSYVHMFLEGRRVGQAVTRETKALIESIVATDYDGRALIELIQNAHDALDPSTRDGRILIRLDRTRGEHGTLTVANSGTPFSEANFHAICRVALSTKDPDDGIGNKGVGFKSILQISLSPAIYSSASEVPGAFDGFCFRFASYDDFEVIAHRVDPEDQELPHELRLNVSALKLPVPITQVPSGLSEIASRGFVTAVDAELRSTNALQLARAMIGELKNTHTPIHLFLERISSIVIEEVASDGSVASHLLERKLRSCADHGTFATELVDISGDDSFLLLKRRVSAEVVREAIATSRADGRIGETYERWSGDAEVSIAVRADGALVAGRFYTYLPMEVASPFPGHVNGPFFGHLNRKSMERSVPLNAVLLDAVCDLAVDVVLQAASIGIELAPETIVDLVSWRGPDGPTRLAAAFERRGLILAEAKVLPTESAEEKAALESVWIWDPAGRVVLNPESVCAATDTPFLFTGLGSERRTAVEHLATFCGLPMRPSDREFAEWSSAVAVRALEYQRATGSLDIDWWQQLYDELAGLLPKAKALFDSLPIVLDDSGELLAPGVDGGPMLLFHPRAAEQSGVNIALPLALAGEVRFTHRDLPRLQGQSKRAGRIWLELFVKEYSSETILELVKKGMGGRRTHAHRCELLRFAADVWFGAVAERPTQALLRQALFVPTVGGWRVASQARFSDGWGEGEDFEISASYSRFAEDVAADIPELASIRDALLLPPGDDSWEGRTTEQWYEFLRAAGVQTGLYPERVGRALEVNGGVLGFNYSPGQIAGMSLDEVNMWVAAAAATADRLPLYRQPYISDEPIWRLPGQQRYAHFSTGLRERYAELIVRGIGHWPETSLRMVFSRFSTAVTVRWPSLVRAFLSETPWMPQRSVKGDREVSFTIPREGWWVRETDGPVYLPAQPRRFTRWNRDQTLTRLALLGTRFWDDELTALDRLNDLPGFAGQYSARDREMVEIRNAYSEAWRQMVQRPMHAPQKHLLVSRQGQLCPLGLPTDETVYIVDSKGSEQARLLEQTPAPVLALRERSVAEAVCDLLGSKAPLSVRLASAAKVEVRVDDEPADEIAASLLVERWPWMLDLVLMLLEARSSTFHRAGARRLSEVADSLRRVRLAQVETVEARLDGHPVDTGTGGGSVTVEQDGDPLILILSSATVGRHGSPLESAGQALMAILGYPELQDALTLSIVRLTREGVLDPTREQIAWALELSAAEARLVSAVPSIGAALVESSRVLLAMFDPDLAAEMSKLQDGFGSEQELAAWIRDRAMLPNDITAERIVELSSVDDLPTAIDELGLALGHVNRVLRTFGHKPLHNIEGHARAFRAYCDRYLAGHIDGLRHEFLDEFRARRPLTEYLQLARELSALEPPTPWLDDYWQLPESAIANYFTEWLAGRGVATAPSVALEPLRQVQDRNRRVVQGTMAQLRYTVRAWERKHDAGIRVSIPDMGALLARMELLGRLDFEPIDSGEVVETLAEAGEWPAAMPRSLTLDDLGLTNDDVDTERRREREEDEARRRKDEVVQFGGRDYSSTEDDRLALIEAVLADLPAKVLQTPPSVSAIAAAPSRTRTRGSNGSVGGGAVSQIKTAQIGFVGELIAAQWIREQYGVHPKDSWRSGFRARYLGDEGRDDLGYDFEVVTPSERILIEVKSTTGDESQFEMGETEVRRAQRVVAGERYIVLFITRVLESDKTALHVLPNPFADGGLANYALLGQKVRLSFAIPDPTP